MQIAIALAAGVLMAQPAFAQWPLFKEQGIPRKADGTLNPDGPPPRAADGHVDLSGLWDRAGGFGIGPPQGQRPQGQGQGPGQGQAQRPQGPGPAAGGPAAGGPAAGGPAAGGPPRGPRTPPRPVLPADGSPPLANFGNVGAGFPDGLPYQPLAAQLRAERIGNNMKNNPDAHCLPMGLTQLHLHPQPRKLVQTPGLIVIMYEGNQGLRQIFTDGRKVPELNDDLQPWWYGYSAGHWEGDTLVVETVGFRDDVWLDVNGSPLTSKGRMTERFRRPSFGLLQIDVTIDDPAAYTKPFTFRINQRLTADDELIEFVCNENERSSEHFDR
ncbi:MAG TPA: hypothetical protein VE907_17615 [Gammaproteobacteria bacterium]|nr:hypothetical protein [Gammaproteobacteria bacterium]